MEEINLLLYLPAALAVIFLVWTICVSILASKRKTALDSAELSLASKKEHIQLKNKRIDNFDTKIKDFEKKLENAERDLEDRVALEEKKLKDTADRLRKAENTAASRKTALEANKKALQETIRKVDKLEAENRKLRNKYFIEPGVKALVRKNKNGRWYGTFKPRSGRAFTSSDLRANDHNDIVDSFRNISKNIPLDIQEDA